MTEQSCDTCAKRSGWEVQTPSNPKYPPYLLAKCNHTPLPAFWGESRPLMVAPHCGTECGNWKESKATP